jgi:hypothetical protein
MGTAKRRNEMEVASLVMLMVWVLVFAVLAWLAFWICDKGGAPQPVRWIVMGVFLIILIVFLLQKSGVWNSKIGGKSVVMLSSSA